MYALDWLSYWLYALDWLLLPDLARTLQFKRIGNAVQVVWEHPPGFKSDGSGYIYISLPWISRNEWHAFSIVSHPTLPNHSCVCMTVVGDWTKAVYQALSKPTSRGTSRPGWLYDPFSSPFSTATGYDNLVCVASGIGVTPSISFRSSTWPRRGWST